MKCNNILFMEIPGGEDSEQGIENIFEDIMTEIFPNVEKEKVIQVQGSQRIPNKSDPKRLTLKHIII